MSDMILPSYRILELGDERVGFCGKLLADLGAEVVKVEPPEGDAGRYKEPFFGGQRTAETSLDFLAFNTNKRSLALDIRSREGRGCFLEIVRRADALIEGLPPGQLDDLDLGYPMLHKINPRLVMTSVSPYGQTGPRRHHLSSDLIAMATSGLMQVTGDPEGPPTRLGDEQSRFAPALYAALGVAAALFQRDWHGGSGQHVDVSAQEALLSFYLEQHPVLCWHVRRKNVTRVGPISSLAVPAGVFPCQDGWVGLGIITAPEWDVLSRWLHEVTGSQEILAEELRGGIHARAAYRDLIEAVLLDFTTRQTRVQLFHEGQRRNLVVVPVNTVADLLADPALAQSNLWKELDHPVVGRLRYPMNLFGAEVQTAERAAPLLGEANEEILCGELGLTGAGLQHLQKAGVLGPASRKDHGFPGLVLPRRKSAQLRPAREQTGHQKPFTPVLDGVRVVEFGPFIALPLTGRILAALGATVIKVETDKLLDQLNFVPPWGNGMGQPEYQALKRRITLDVRTPEGALVLRRLVAASDVFMTNFRRDALTRWGVDLDDLRRRHPQLIVVHQAGFGAGPYESYKLYGIMAQHVCGVSMMSGEPGAPPCCLNSAYSDYHTPILQALAVLGALDRRRHGGQGALIEGSIFRSGVCTVGTALLELQASGSLPVRRGNHDAVAVPHNVYPCRGQDEWCAVAVWDDRQWARLCQGLRHEQWVEDERFATASDRRKNQEELDALLSRVTSHWNKNELMGRLQANGVPAGIVAKGADLANDPQLGSRELYSPTTYYIPNPYRPGIEWEQGPDVPASRLPILFSETPCLSGPYRRAGADNEFVYHQLLGMSLSEVRSLTNRGVLV